MIQIDRKQAYELMSAHQKKDFKVDGRVFEEIDKPGSIFKLMIEDQDSFLSLIWHTRNDSRLLTPSGQSRTLRDVAQRMIDDNYSFNLLATNFGKSSSEHNPNWFTDCPNYYDEFDYGNFGYIVLTSATEDESSQSPDGSFYIYDGSHKSLVLAYKLLKGEIDFEPVICLLLLPRRK